MDSLYVQARQMGAAAIINFERSVYPVEYYVSEGLGLRVSGFAIDREGN